MSKPKIHVILGSIREGRSGERVARWFMNIAREREDAVIQLVDLKDFPLPLFADARTPLDRGTDSHPDPQVQKWIDVIAQADGYIIINPEYNHSVSGPLKNAIDYPGAEWRNKAIGFVSYGSAAGGARAAEHLRQIAAELHMFDVREQVLIPDIWAAFDEQGNLIDPQRHEKTARAVLDQVIALAVQLKK